MKEPQVTRPLTLLHSSITDNRIRAERELGYNNITKKKPLSLIALTTVLNRKILISPTNAVLSDFTVTHLTMKILPIFQLLAFPKIYPVTHPFHKPISCSITRCKAALGFDMPCGPDRDTFESFWSLPFLSTKQRLLRKLLEPRELEPPLTIVPAMTSFLALIGIDISKYLLDGSIHPNPSPPCCRLMLHCRSRYVCLC